MKLLVTIDVEEEGLFTGKYDPLDPPVTNVKALSMLDPVFRKWAIRPTLLLSYHVARCQAWHETIWDLKDRWNGEIGAHLHLWNTPPLVKFSYPEPIPSERVPEEILAAKLESLLDIFRQTGESPTSFRMGRFNMGRRMWSIVENTPIVVDSSVAPMRIQYGGPDHLTAPTDPYFPDRKNPFDQGDSHILEVPITIVPLIGSLGHALERWRAVSVLPENAISWTAANILSLPVQPVWTDLARLKIGAWLHRRRGGQALTMFFHSSELVPGFCPQHPTAGHIDRFLDKLDSFFAWLHRSNHVESLTLTELRHNYSQSEEGRALVLSEKLATGGQ